MRTFYCLLFKNMHIIFAYEECVTFSGKRKKVLRMLSFYGLNVIIFLRGMLSFSEPANVTIFVLSFFLVQILCYHLCYHLMLSFIVIISPLFSFSWKRDTLAYESSFSILKYILDACFHDVSNNTLLIMHVVRLI